MIRRITRGTTRTVFLIGRWAIKVPNGRWGITFWLQGRLANLHERKWATYGYSDLCPVIWADPLGLVVIMPRAEPLPPDTPYSVIERIVEGHPRRGWELPVETKLDSFGELNGRVVAVDYGN